MPLSWKAPPTGIGIRNGTAARTGRIGFRTAVASRKMTSALPPVSKRQFRWRGAGMATRESAFVSFADAQKQNAPGMESEGIRLSSEDRGNRPSRGRDRSADGVASFARAQRERIRAAHVLRGFAVVGDAAWG
jgi:hypothetical protein